MEKRKTYADKKKYLKNYSIQKCDALMMNLTKKSKINIIMHFYQIGK